MRLLHTRESVHPAKCGNIVCLQEEDPSVKIGKDWTALAVEVSEGHHHKKSIDNESYEIVNVDMEGGIFRGCVSQLGKISED